MTVITLGEVLASYIECRKLGLHIVDFFNFVWHACKCTIFFEC